MTERTPSSDPGSSGPPVFGGSERSRFEQEFRRSHASVWIVALALTGHRADAEDVVQEAAMLAAQKFATFRAGSNFTAWLAQFVRHVASNRRRSAWREARRHDRGIEPGAVNLPAPNPSPTNPITERGELRAEQDALDDRMVRALGDLEPIARACLLLRTIQGSGYDEIAHILDIPAGTAMSHVFRARARMASTLKTPTD